MTRRSAAGLLVAAILATAAGIHWGNRPGVAVDRAAVQLVGLALPDAEGRPVRLDQWSGKVMIVNFWATWCEPCRLEVPALIRTQSKFASNGVQVLGIAVDSAVKVKQFAAEYGVNYPLVIGSLDVIELSRQLGNQAAGLPFTVILDRSRKVVRTRLGGITEPELEDAIRKSSD